MAPSEEVPRRPRTQWGLFKPTHYWPISSFYLKIEGHISHIYWYGTWLDLTRGKVIFQKQLLRTRQAQNFCQLGDVWVKLLRNKAGCSTTKHRIRPGEVNFVYYSWIVPPNLMIYLTTVNASPCARHYNVPSIILINLNTNWWRRHHYYLYFIVKETEP